MAERKSEDEGSQPTSPPAPPVTGQYGHLLRHLTRPGPVAQNPSPETLESSFSRLAIFHTNHPLHQGDAFEDYEDIMLPLPSPRLGQNLYNNVRNPSVPMGFQDYAPYRTMYGYDDVNSWDSFVPRSYQNNPNVSNLIANRNRTGSSVFSQNRSHNYHNNTNGVSVSRRSNWSPEPLNSLSLADLRGRIVAMAKDQYGSKLLQRNLGPGNARKEEIDMVFYELIKHVGRLMVDSFGHTVVQKLVEVCNEEQRTQILQTVTQYDFQLVSICFNQHGTRAVQRLLENFTNPQQISIVISALIPGAVALAKDMHGHHVIRHCLTRFSAKANKYLLNEVVKNCFGIATDQCGCCLLQQCLGHSQGETRYRLVAEIIANALVLAEDCYGNYVVQYVLGMRIPQITENVLAQLEGRYTALSCSKYGSHVVEKCLEVGKEQCTRIINELLASQDFSMLLVDPFGNYVIQTALLVSEGTIREDLLLRIEENTVTMYNNIYGKKAVCSIFGKRKRMPNTCANIRGHPT